MAWRIRISSPRNMLCVCVCAHIYTYIFWNEENPHIYYEKGTKFLPIDMLCKKYTVYEYPTPIQLKSLSFFSCIQKQPTFCHKGYSTVQRNEVYVYNLLVKSSTKKTTKEKENKPFFSLYLSLTRTMFCVHSLLSHCLGQVACAHTSRQTHSNMLSCAHCVQSGC